MPATSTDKPAATLTLNTLRNRGTDTLHPTNPTHAVYPNAGLQSTPHAATTDLTVASLTSLQGLQVHSGHRERSTTRG